MPSSSTASLVIDDVIICPPPISTRTWEVVAPFLTSITVPLIWLRALMRMMISTLSSRDLFRRGRDGLLIEKKMGLSSRFSRHTCGISSDVSYRIQQVCDRLARKCYCLASGAARTWRQAAGNCASVGPVLGVGGSVGGLGWITSSLNQ